MAVWTRPSARYALALNPDLAAAWVDLGVVAERRGRPAGAMAHYRQALAIDPGFVDARQNLARALILTGDLEGARAQLLRLSALRPDDDDAAVTLAYVELRLGRHRSARARVAEVLRRAPDHAGARLVRAIARGMEGDLERATRALEALRTDPTLGQAASVRLQALRVATPAP